METYKAYYDRFLRCDMEQKEATYNHWERVHTNALRDKNETLIIHAARVLAVYNMAWSGIPFPV